MNVGTGIILFLMTTIGVYFEVQIAPLIALGWILGDTLAQLRGSFGSEKE